MKVIFLSHMYPRSRREYYLARSRAGLAAAADAHQYAIALGLNEVCDDFNIVNLPALFYFPLRYRDFKHKGGFILENGLKINNLSFNTLMEYTFYSQYKAAKKTLIEIVGSTSEDVYIVVYGIKPQLMHAAIDIRDRYSGKVKLCDIIPDLPEDVNTHGSIVSSALALIRNAFHKTAQEYFSEFDSFVLLTKYMTEKVPCETKPYIVSEGIYEEKTVKRTKHKEDSHLFKIFYGGMLHERFGIINLLNAVSQIKNPHLKLQLCGYGDCIDRIKDASKDDKRIEYLGVLSRDEVLRYQTEASLLINPRIPDSNPYTRYSFPSKTMEYFGSGAPTLLYRLDGIPEEYYKYCYSLDNNHTDVSSLKTKIEEIISTPIQRRIELANRAREFVLEKKNYRVVGAQIFDLLNKS